MQTISTPLIHEEKIQRSRFITFLYPILDLEQAKELLTNHNREYANATHNCYAYIWGLNQEIQYYSDAGEPSGTAGKPMLNALLRFDLSNILVIVTRYYGGVKLGVKGLIEAYGGCVQNAIEHAQLIPLRKLCQIRIAMDYSIFEHLKYQITPLDAEITDTEFSEQIHAVISIPESRFKDLKLILENHIQNAKLTLLS